VAVKEQREFPTGPLILYTVTAALEAPVILARYAAIYVVAAIALKATGHPSTDAAEWAKLAILPALWSAVALVNPAGGGWWWRQQLGGREPSTREQMAYRTSMEALEASTMIPLPHPKQWFVVDESEPDAAVCGDTLMLTRGLLEGPSVNLSAVVAHQMGHLEGIDARLTAALNRLVIGRGQPPRANIKAQTPPTLNPRQTSTQNSNPGPRQPVVVAGGKVEKARITWMLTRWATRMTIALLRGGLALRLTAPAWGQIWREEEYEADRFAASIGWGEKLAEVLEAEQLKHDHPIPLVGLTDHTHPPTELRIDALRALAKQQPETPPESDPQLPALAEPSGPAQGVGQSKRI
jgi:Zn-dependent protease with chaperone function